MQLRFCISYTIYLKEGSECLLSTGRMKIYGFFLFSMLTACATTQNLTAEERAGIHTISITQILVPEYLKSINHLGVFNPENVGLGKEYETLGELHTDILRKRKFDMAIALKGELIKQINEKETLKIVNKSGDVELEATMSKYGFVTAGPFTTNQKVDMWIELKLYVANKERKNIWRSTGTLTAFSDKTESFGLDELINSPGLMQNELETAVEYVVKFALEGFENI